MAFLAKSEFFSKEVLTASDRMNNFHHFLSGNSSPALRRIFYEVSEALRHAERLYGRQNKAEAADEQRPARFYVKALRDVSDIIFHPRFREMYPAVMAHSSCYSHSPYLSCCITAGSTSIINSGFPSS